MGYRELLDLYKKGQLDERQKEQVEADIEKQEAISEYLFEQEEQTGVEMFGGLAASSWQTEGEKPPVQPDFARMVNRSVRRALIRTGAAAMAAAMAGVLFVMFLLPRIVDCFYYDPGASTGGLGNQLSLDLEVYTELRMPGSRRDSAIVQGRGYGDYDIMVNQGMSYNGSFTSLAGRISKGKLTWYDPNVLNAPSMNAFAWFQMHGDSTDSLTDLIDAKKHVNYCAAGNAKMAAESLKELDGNGKYIAYATLDRMLPYEAFMDYLDRIDAKALLGDIWCAVCTCNGAGSGTEKDGLPQGEAERFQADNLGFQCILSSSHELDWDREAYPYLVLWDSASIEDADGNLSLEEQEEALRKEDFAKAHFVSMLRYMARQGEFLAMMGDEDTRRYRAAADYVEENGLMVYGFAGIGDKEALRSLNQDEEVYEIYAQRLR